MTDETRLRALLQDGDPVRPEKGKEEGLAPADAERMRRQIVAAGIEAQRWTPWQRPFAIAAIAVLLVVAGTIRHDRAVDPAPASADPVASATGGDGGRRQLQFSTSGGTRIIWIFDDNLRLQESMP